MCGEVKVASEQKDSVVGGTAEFHSVPLNAPAQRKGKFLAAAADGGCTGIKEIVLCGAERSFSSNL